MVHDELTPSEQMAKEADDFSGQVFLKKRLKDDPTRYMIISINYVGIKGLAKVFALIARHDLELWGDIPLKTYDDVIPRCPIHAEMRRSTKGGEWFCPAKLADRTFCKHKVKM